MYEDAIASPCDACYRSKAHKLPHTRRDTHRRKARAGDGSGDVWVLDTVSWPYPGEHRERYIGILGCLGRTIYVLPSKSKDAIPYLAVEHLDKIARQLKTDETRLQLRYAYEGKYTQQDEDQEEAGDFFASKTLISDGAAEFATSDGPLAQFCKKKGMVKLMTCRHDPNANPAENYAKIITQGIMTLMTQSALPPRFWVRAAIYFSKIYERIPN